MTTEMPPRLAGRFYLTEGGAETELLYKWGFDLPEFAMFTLLDNSGADAVVHAMYRRYFEVAAHHGTGMLVAAHDYRASPDWSAKLGYNLDQLADFERRTIAFLDAMRREYADRVSDVYIAGCIGPRGDAYGTGGEITEDEAEEYHATQLATLKETVADMAVAMTFNNVPEAVGVIRAAGRIGMPVGVSLTLTTEGRLRSGPTLAEAIKAIDARTDGAAQWFGINCSHPLEFEPAIAEPGPWQDRLRFVRPNAARMEKVALCKLGHLEDGDPVELGMQMGDVARRLPKADILGGCCGTDDRHLHEIGLNAAPLFRSA
ncbi:homocysteine S-methyltransferase family protein [Defluviimonas sp. WL0002]|uniref:Homocysteine S-methyltransferase family protein n=1 Tax=Albidovulum marisflavi TaxID=2984159 RepID=A0ABT2Z958_9RHOB|nr:homocysteine S-methyltransferase family protein [Defluviimonas sp. WL0002]MCV2867550.1 homocysteine S-methyltransferase family protein [Defluviimonas sp. WL0002]